ncbi:MAG: 3'(2'),5'-bisphosphate nucleotidase CysQ [Myxococcales bacterium]|nr:3'(2'),5'-bisphosphate nucleotidase CysQ [Myxococcales bacterium]USN50337.1 MAG: 3'(2'),5'-bisphosphate nucleotidase CysQ [Myxococcales bacterium]
MDLQKELNIAKQLAREAGKIALEKQSKLIVKQKPLGQGPVSNADQIIDDFISQELKKFFPKDQIISEESYQEETVNKLGRVWFVDPIDGTASYIAGLDDFVIMIGLMINGKTSLGVIYQPTSGIMWSALSNGENRECVREHGNKQKIITPGHWAKNNHQLRIITSRTFRSNRQEQFIKTIDPSLIIRRGSFGLKAMLVLDGVADIYLCWSKRIKLWDSCAPHAIIQAAGGCMVHLDNSPLDFKDGINHQRSILISSHKLEDSLMLLLRNIEQG